MLAWLELGGDDEVVPYSCHTIDFDPDRHPWTIRPFKYSRSTKSGSLDSLGGSMTRSKTILVTFMNTLTGFGPDFVRSHELFLHKDGV